MIERVMAVGGRASSIHLHAIRAGIMLAGVFHL